MCVATLGPFRGGILLDGSSGTPEPRSPPANQVRGTPTVPSRSNKPRDAAPSAATSSDADAQAAFGRSAGRQGTALRDPAAMQDTTHDPAASSRRAHLPAARPPGVSTRARLLSNMR